MKLQLIVLFGFCTSVYGQNEVPKYEILDGRLFAVLSKMADTINLANNGKGLIEVNFDIPTTRTIYSQSPRTDTVSFDFADKSQKIGLGFLVIAKSDIWRVPTAYTMIKDVPCVIYTGIEGLMSQEEESTIKTLRKKFKNRIGGVAKDHMWFVILRKDTVTIQSLCKLP
jgi:hypothetical protein